MDEDLLAIADQLFVELDQRESLGTADDASDSSYAGLMILQVPPELELSSLG